MNTEDLSDLKLAREKLENTSLAAKVTNLIGMPLEKGFEKLPGKVRDNLGSITQAALMAAMKSALFTIKDEPNTSKSNRMHKLAVATSGGLGGALGFAALSIELPLSTTIMLRSIADVARSEGESIYKLESRLACMEVFAFGSPQNKGDDAVETGYLAVRASLARSVAEAANHIACKGLAKESSPALVRMINLIAQRFSIQRIMRLTLGTESMGAIMEVCLKDRFQY